MKSFKCPYCKHKFTSPAALEKHLEKQHQEQLGGISSANHLFNIRNDKTYGTCIMYKKVSSCEKFSEFNEKTRKYNRLCKNIKCKEAYVQSFKDRMKKKYGTNHLLNDPDHQKKMLSNRSISGFYKWSDGRNSMEYVGTYELNFLEYLDLFLEFKAEDILSPCPIHFKYVYDNKDHFYIPDFYIPTLNLIVEVKSFENNHYRERDKHLEKLKEDAVKKESYNFIKIGDKNYNDFLRGLAKGLWAN